ncbi:MAG: hypothetical protein R3F56_07100 [Planctomycetota bacterium]
MASLPGQREPKPEKVDAFQDPYTKGDAEQLKALGYVAIGQFLWLGDVTTAQVQQILGDDIAIFIETEHFKLASTLRSFPWPKDKEWRAALRAEVEALAERCPGFKTKSRSLDPWLRAHLYAQRLEALYADFCGKLGIAPGTFPEDRGGKRTADYMGEGPYLGQPGKYLVVLAHKALSAGTYTRAFQGSAARDTTRFNHDKEGSLATVIAAEFAEKALRDDRNLHCHLAYSVTHNLVDGFKYYWQSVPAWLSEGISLWFSRPIREEFLNFSGTDDAGATTLRGHEWERRVRMRVDNDVWPKAADLCQVMSAAELDFSSHMMVWSRVDFLMRGHAEKFGRFVARMKAPMTNEARQPTVAEIVQRQAQALRDELGFDEAGFDAAWLAFVRETYSRK